MRLIAKTGLASMFAFSTAFVSVKDGKCKLSRGFDCVGNDMTSKSAR